MKHASILLTLGGLALSTLTHGQTDPNPTGTPLTIYVSPRGNDRWSGLLNAANGTKTDGPKRTLDGARAVIHQRGFTDTVPVGGIIVQLLPGTYNLSSQFVLETRFERGTPTKPIVIRGSGTDNTFIDGSTPLRVWRRVTREPRINSDLLRRIFVADLRQHRVSNFAAFQRKGFPYDTQFSYPELIFRNKRMTVAQYPNGKDWLRVNENHAGSDTSFQTDIPATRGWNDLTDVWAYGYFGNQWADSYEKVASFSNGTVNLSASVRYGIAPGERFRFVNLLQELDSPGEYYIDRARGKVYFYPPTTGFQNSVSLTGVNEMLVKLADCEYTTFEDMTLQNCRASAIEVHRGRNVTLRNLGVRNTGLDGIRIFNGVNHTVDTCKVTEIGETGIYVLGGNRQTLEPSGHEIINNEVTDFSKICRSHKPGIRVEGVGHLIANNDIFRGPGMGIFLLGNDHIIEKNHLRYLCWDMDDAGALHMGQNPTFLGNVIRQNLIEDLPRRNATRLDNKINAIYLDDFTCGTQVYDNVIRRADMGVQLGGGSQNEVFNNVFQDCRLGIQLDARGTSWNSSWITSGRLAQRCAEVNLTTGVYALAYPQMGDYITGNPAIPRNNRLERNVIDAENALIFYDGVINSDVDDPTAPIVTLDNYYGSNPGFVDWANLNFQVIPNMDADWIGFTAIDMSNVGAQINGKRLSPVPDPVPPTDY